MSFAVELPPELLDEVARKAAELLIERQSAEPERWLTHAEAARFLSVSSSQLYTLASQRHRNHLPLTKEGTKSFYLASELTRWRLDNDNGGPP